MVFDNEERVLTLGLTNYGKQFWTAHRIMSKDEIMDGIKDWKFVPGAGLSLVNIVGDRFGPSLKQIVWYNLTKEMDSIPGDLMDISLTHGITHICSVENRQNCIGLAETSDGQTNIDADVIDALMRKIGWNGEKKGRR